jgi:hypothetical protein
MPRALNTRNGMIAAIVVVLRTLNATQMLPPFRMELFGWSEAQVVTSKKLGVSPEGLFISHFLISGHSVFGAAEEYHELQLS